MRNVFGMSTAALLLVACARASLPGGPVSVQVIQPAGPGCSHTVAPAPLQTLTDLTTLSGAVGRVVRAKKKLVTDADLLDENNFEPTPSDFFESGGAFYPSNYESLYSASLYYAIEMAYLMFRTLDPAADPSAITADMRRTLIIKDPTLDEDGTPIEDNAAYVPVLVPQEALPRNYFFSFPASSLQEMALGLNVGVLGHEFTHLIFQHLFNVPERRGQATSFDKRAPRISSRTIGSLDEGIADYFGFLVSRDPQFFLCSFPTENRDMLKEKYFSEALIQRMASASSYDIHEGGAVFAAINYQIGTAIGYENNGRALLQLMRSLDSCASPGRAEVTFAQIAACHAQAGGSYASQIQSVYAKYLGSYGGGL